MCRQLAGQEVAFADLDLFILGIARYLDNLHPIPQRARDLLHVVRRGDEEHLGKIVGCIDEVIGEESILLGIEHFQQRGGRIAPEVSGKFVDLIEQDDRIGRLRLTHCRNDASRHGADIGAPMPADLGFVAHATQADSHEFATHRGGNRSTQTGLPDPWGACETQYLRGSAVDSFRYRYAAFVPRENRECDL